MWTSAFVEMSRERAKVAIPIPTLARLRRRGGVSPQVPFPRPTNLLDSVRNLRVLNLPAIVRQQKIEISTSAWADPRLHVTSGLPRPRT